MKKFLRNTALFLLPLLALMYPLDYLLSKSLAKSGSAAEGEISVWTDIYDGDINANVAVYGSSRASMHFDTKILSDGLCTPAYNFGITGHNFWTQYYRHTQYLKHNKKPRYILLSMDPFSMIKKVPRDNISQFLPYSLFNTDMAAYTIGKKEFSAWDYYVPLVRYVGQYQSVGIALQNMTGKESAKPLRYKGYEARDEQWNSDFVKAQELLGSYKVTVDPEMRRLLQRFVAECQEQNIKLIIVNTPQYYESRKFTQNSDAVMQELKSFANQQGIPFLDYSDSPLCYNKAYFFNATHLNKTGAELFTKQLVSDLKKLQPDIANCH